MSSHLIAGQPVAPSSTLLQGAGRLQQRAITAPRVSPRQQASPLPSPEPPPPPHAEPPAVAGASWFSSPSPDQFHSSLSSSSICAENILLFPQCIVRAISGQPYDRVFNFSAGPAVLPVEVLEQARDDLVNWKGSGMSVMEMSHRGKEFESIIKQAEADLRTLLGVPDAYKVLFLQGGASTQFAAIPLNLAAESATVDYVVTGSWSKKAVSEAKKYCAKVNVAATGDNKSIPAPSSWTLSPDAAYVHYCDNETIQGVEFKGAPDVGGRILVADMSSNFCSKTVDVSKYGLIYAGAQKNIGPAGVTIVIVREDLVNAGSQPITPTMLDYKTMDGDGSMYNTPPCWSIYICGLVFSKMIKDGGLAGAQARNEAKAKVIYDAIAASNGFYATPVDPACRSLMNVPFTIPSNADLEKEFISGAAKLGMVQLKGHRSVGGMRASIYNSMPMDGVQALAAFMGEFAAQNRK
jgi:phosphoserine aminotransferase